MSQRVLITGGSRGIGAATVHRFYREGYQVAFCYHKNFEAAKALALQLPGVLAIQADVANEAAVNSLFDQVLSSFGGLEALVCNAGIALPSSLIMQTDLKDFERVMAVNVTGTFLCCRRAADVMVKAHGGSIVTLSSMWGRTGGSCETAYSASKGAVISFSKALAKELGPSGVRVNCLCPGVIDTDMNQNLQPEACAALAEETPLMRLGTPEEIAAALYFLCGTDASFITGQILGVDGGIVI